MESKKITVCLLPAEGMVGLELVRTLCQGKHKSSFQRVLAGVCNQDSPNVQKVLALYTRYPFLFG